MLEGLQGYLQDADISAGDRGQLGAGKDMGRCELQSKRTAWRGWLSEGTAIGHGDSPGHRTLVWGDVYLSPFHLDAWGRKQASLAGTGSWVPSGPVLRFSSGPVQFSSEAGGCQVRLWPEPKLRLRNGS